MAEAASRLAGTGRRPRRSRPIAIYLFVLTLVALVPAFVFSAILLQRHNEAQEQVVETLIVGTARSIVQAVEREIVANITTLRVLATAPNLAAGDYEGFDARVRDALAATPTDVYLLDSNLRTIVNTRAEFGTAPGAISADQASGQQVMDTGEIFVSDVSLGPVSEQWEFNILLPVSGAGGEPMVLGLSRDAEDLSRALLSNKLPSGWSVALIDTDGTVIAASPGAANSGDHFPVADPDNLASSSGWVSLQDESLQAVVQRSPLTGWTLVTWAPRELVSESLANAIWSLLIGGVLLAAVVILIIYWLSLQIGRSVHGLEDDAKRLGAGDAVPVRDYPVTEIATVAEALGEASRKRQAAESEVRFLMRELAHRSKNQMTVIAAMAKQTARGAESVAEFVQSFEKRILGLASSTDLLLAHGVAGVDLRELLARQIEPFCPLDTGRVTLVGPPVRLNTQAAQILGMAGHELATNAVKYGAFAGERGTLAVDWAPVGDRLRLTWRETADIQPGRAERRGFGTTVVESMVGHSLGAEVRRTVHADGIEWLFALPLAAIDPQATPHGLGELADGEVPQPDDGSQPAIAATGEEK